MRPTLQERLGVEGPILWEPLRSDPSRQAREELDALTAPQEPDPDEEEAERQRISDLERKAALFREAAQQQREIATLDPVMAEVYARWEQQPEAREGIGSRTLLDLWTAEPEPLLLDPWLHPSKATLLYGKGGVGKGFTACWLILRLVREGKRVMVLDYEGNDIEWVSRLRAMGMTATEAESVAYREPYNARDWNSVPSALDKAATVVREQARSLGIDYLVIDSATAAGAGGEGMGGEESARRLFAGLAEIGLPSLILAHIPKAAQPHPSMPFGSQAWNALARRSWSVEAMESGDDEVTEGIDLTRHLRLEYRNHKASSSEHAPDQHLDFAFYPTGGIEVTTTDGVKMTLANTLWNILTEPMTVKTIREVMLDEKGSATSVEVIIRTLRKHPEKFVADTTAGRGKTRWSRR